MTTDPEAQPQPDPNPWRRWWGGLSAADRDAVRHRQGQPLRHVTHELTTHPNGEPLGVERTDRGGGTFLVPQYLLDDDDTDDQDDDTDDQQEMDR